MIVMHFWSYFNHYYYCCCWNGNCIILSIFNIILELRKKRLILDFALILLKNVFLFWQVVLFICQLRQILDSCRDCRDKYKLVPISGAMHEIADALVALHYRWIIDTDEEWCPRVMLLFSFLIKETMQRLLTLIWFTTRW